MTKPFNTLGFKSNALLNICPNFSKFRSHYDHQLFTQLLCRGGHGAEELSRLHRRYESSRAGSRQLCPSPHDVRYCTSVFSLGQCQGNIKSFKISMSSVFCLAQRLLMLPVLVLKMILDFRTFWCIQRSRILDLHRKYCNHSNTTQQYVLLALTCK